MVFDVWFFYFQSRKVIISFSSNIILNWLDGTTNLLCILCFFYY